MQLHLKASKIWLASEAVDFRRGINGLSTMVVNQLAGRVQAGVYVFYNRAKNKLKLLAYHRNGMLLIYKCLDKKKFTINCTESALYEMDEKQLSWLLAGLDWVEMSVGEGLVFDDYF